jgi:hypothetical protein
MAMARTLLRVATLHQVLKVTPLSLATQRAVAEGGHNWGLWEFDRDAVGEIGDQDKVSPNHVATIGKLHDSRLKWMSAIPEELEKHQTLLRDFTKGDFLDPPVLIHDPSSSFDYHVRDGAHRIHAAYQHMASAPNRRLRVYWNRLAWCIG